MNYYELPMFANIYFEDSYVLGVKEEEGSLIFDLEVVLTENSPMYRSPMPGEQYCYSKAKLVFRDVISLLWLENNLTKIEGRSQADYGNIDIFNIDDDVYDLSGDWGAVRFRCKGVDFRLS